jgi:thiamine biosynthesis lipoprotein
MEYDEFRAMNSDIVVAAEGDAGAIALGFSLVRAMIARLEARFTRFSETSELAQLNRASGQWFMASPELFEIVRSARDLSEATGGLFDPSILDALENAGYDRSMDDPLRGAVRPAALVRRRSAGLDEIELDAGRRAIRLPRGMRLDLGGIAKGWIAERAALELARQSEACAVSAGGDVFTAGLPAGESAWSIEMENPRYPNQALTILRVGPGAVATSSTTKRRWQQGAREQHHLIDPRTGQPAETPWVSVTAIAPHAAQAEAFAKALLIAGPDQAERLAARQPGLAFIAVDHALQMWGSPNARELLNVEALEYA